MEGRHSVSRVAGRRPDRQDTFASHNPARWDDIVGHLSPGDRRRTPTRRWPRRGRPTRLATDEPHLAGGAVRQPGPAHQARHRRPRPLMARECGKILNECRAEVIEGLHMVQYVFGTAGMPIGDVVASARFPRKTPSCAASRGASSPSSRRGTSRSPCRSGCSGPACWKGTRSSSSRPRTRPPIGQRLVELFVEGRLSRRASINLVHGDGETSAKRWSRNPTSTSSSSPAATRSASEIQQISADAVRSHRRLRDGLQSRPSSSARTPGSIWP